MVFLLGLGSCLLHVQVRERKRWSPELESLRGGVYMDGWPARCGDRVDRGFSLFLVGVVACATNTFVRVMVFNSMVLFTFESWLFLTEVKCFGFKFNDIIFRILF